MFKYILITLLTMGCRMTLVRETHKQKLIRQCSDLALEEGYTKSRVNSNGTKCYGVGSTGIPTLIGDSK